jgi:hypothetical protein
VYEISPDRAIDDTELVEQGFDVGRPWPTTVYRR